MAKRLSLQEKLAIRKAKVENRKRQIEDAVIEAMELNAPTPMEIVEFVTAKCGHYHERAMIRMIYRIYGIKKDVSVDDAQWILL